MSVRLYAWVWCVRVRVIVYMVVYMDAIVCANECVCVVTCVGVSADMCMVISVIAIVGV